MPFRRMQALVGDLISATDVAAALTTDCTLARGQSFCNVKVSDYVTMAQSIRISWTCICGLGMDPTVDPITGACTPCKPGATPVPDIRRSSERRSKSFLSGRQPWAWPW